MEPLSIVLSFIRASKPEESYAFDFKPQAYTRMISDQAVASPSFPWTRELLGQLELLREGSSPRGLVESLGDLLARFFADAKWDAELRSLGEARTGRRVHLTFRSNAAELFALPWELVTVPGTDERLGAIANILVRYEWTGTISAPARSSAPARPRVLFAWAGDVPHEEHLKVIEEAVRDSDRAVDFVALANASFETLKRALEDSPVHALHLLCHGEQAGVKLARGGSAASTVLVDAAKVERLLTKHANSLRFVALAACDSGKAGVPGARLGSVAQRLHRAGIQSVLASRYPLSKKGSCTLARSLYRALLVDDATLEEAVLVARDAVDRPESFDWASLQLYARAGDGDATRLFPARRREHEELCELVEELLDERPALMRALASLLKKSKFRRSVLPFIKRETALSASELRRVAGDAKTLAGALLRLSASTLLHWLRWLSIEARSDAAPEQEEVEELIGVLLPYCYRWDRSEVLSGRVKAGEVIEVPVATETVAEIVLARADQRPAAFVLGRKDQLPMGAGAVALPVEPGTDEEGGLDDFVDGLSKKYMVSANARERGGLERLRARLAYLADPRNPDFQPTYLIVNPYDSKRGVDVGIVRVARLLEELPELRCIRLTRTEVSEAELKELVEPLTHLLSTTEQS